MAEQILQLVNGGAHEETKVGSNLLVAAASRVQFVASRADDHGQLFFHEVVDVFHSRIVQEFRRIFGVARDLVEAVDNLGEFLGSEHTSMFERAGMRAAGGQFKRYQSLVIRKRLLPFFKLRVERLAEAAGPHLHNGAFGAILVTLLRKAGPSLRSEFVTLLTSGHFRALKSFSFTIAYREKLKKSQPLRMTIHFSRTRYSLR